MIILCLGAYSSGSTWVFNVVRRLVAAGGGHGTSLYSVSAGHLLSHIPVEGGDVVVKAHAIERDLLALIGHADVRVIRTWRDPRDAVASLMGRFGRCYHEALGVLQESMAALCAVPASERVLDLRYEDAFTAAPETVQHVAAFLDRAIDDDAARDIFAALGLATVRSRTQAMTDDAGEPLHPDYFDPDTHWHPGHVRAGATGDWTDYLDERLARVVGDALDPLAAPQAWQDRPTRWDGLLFFDPDEQRPPENGRVRLAASDRPTITGPSLRLPGGRWRATIEIEPERPADRLTLLVEVRGVTPGPTILAARLVAVPMERDLYTIEFDHTYFPAPLDIHLTVVAANAATHLIFRGVTFSYLGPSHLSLPGDARPIVS